MNKKYSTGLLAVCTVALAFGAKAQPAFSASMRCSPAVANRVSNLDPNRQLQNTNAVGTCNIGTVPTDSEGQVNDDMIFGVSDWVLAVTDGGTGINLGYKDGVSGVWNIENQVQALLGAGVQFTDLMLAFRIRESGSKYVSYLIDSSSTSGTWDTPFFASDGTPKSVEALSFYYRAPIDGAPIPTPALLPGAVGMAVAALRKRKQVSVES